ncbi:MAG: hypothetical protein P8X62_05005, partial [Flavobacteriaceae bacterium]
FPGIEIREPTFIPNNLVSDPVFESILTKRLLYYGFALNRLEELQLQNKTIRDFIEKHYTFK